MLLVKRSARPLPATAGLLFLVFASAVGCGPAERELLPRSLTWAELRTVRRSVTVTPPGEKERSPFPRERLVDGETISVGEEGLAWLRRDAGATLLVRGPAKLVLHADAIELGQGRVFIDTPPGVTQQLLTPSGPLELSHVRASIDVQPAQDATDVYVLAGEVKTAGLEKNPGARAGETLHVQGKAGQAQAKVQAALTWEDWTGGLATTDRTAQPSPFGVGTVGARKPGDQGAPHAPLAIQRVDVRVHIEGDFALTEVDEYFFNSSSEVVEGIYRFRTPEGAVLHRFGVDRNGALVFGRVKEKASAEAQYQSNVYAGSTEDPALLEWDAPGVYRARLYPIKPGETRRVVVQYGEWLSRTGPLGQRRMYVYPMAAEGSEGSLPHIEELTVSIDLEKSGAKEVRAGMAAVREGQTVIVRAQDLTPRADLAVELFDDGAAQTRAYTAPHWIDLESLPPEERSEARKRSKTEADYVLVPLRASQLPAPKEGLDLALVIDTSAGTDAGSLSIARAAAAALLEHLGTKDRVIVFAGDAQLTPIVASKSKLSPVDNNLRDEVLSALSARSRGGATDMGAMLAQAAAALDPAGDRRSAIVYIGDGSPTVGELSLAELRERMAKLPRPVRIFAMGIGDTADMGILSGLSRGAFAERVSDAHTASRAALRLLEQAERPALLGTSIDLGPGVERVFPRDLGAVAADETLVMIGRLAEGAKTPTTVKIQSPLGTENQTLLPVSIDDHGDMARRWAMARLFEMIDEGTGRAAIVDLGSRHGIITPATSLYVPTFREMTGDERDEFEKRRAKARGPGSSYEGKKKGILDGLLRSQEDKSAPVSVVAAPEPQSADVPKEPMAAATAMAAVEERAPPGGGKAPEKPILLPPAAQEAPIPKPARQSPAFGGGVKSDAKNAAKPADRGFYGGSTNGAPPAPTTAAVQGQGGEKSGNRLEWDGDGYLDNSQPPAVAGDTTTLTETANTKDSGRFVADPVQRTTISIELGEVGHSVRLCGAASRLPLDERIALWNERLASAAGRIDRVAAVYGNALFLCEAPTFRERSRLLSLMLNAVPTVTGRVQLWRLMWNDRGAADVLYRGLVARVKTAEQARELHQALDLKSADPGIIEKLLKESKSPADRVAKLRVLTQQWPDDFELLIKLLYALEDAGDDAGARALARTLRVRPDADARLRTAIGELYLRLAARAEAPEQKQSDELEARRTFGEIVEFSPDDPTARRRLGDLLRAHGWYADAARQYETLAKLTPDDASVPLLLAASAEGLGKLEEAVKWTEKGAQAGSPDADSGPARIARSIAATYLAWGRIAARDAGKKDEEKALLARTDRVLSAERGSQAKVSAKVRATLMWSHPEFHPTLWSNALGAPMPAPDSDQSLGIAQVMLPERADVFVEIRLEPDELEHAARLSAQAWFTVVFDEAGEGEKIVKMPIRFVRDGRTTQRFSVTGGQVREVVP